jgi:hypothetical protein
LSVLVLYFRGDKIAGKTTFSRIDEAEIFSGDKRYFPGGDEKARDKMILSRDE